MVIKKIIMEFYIIKNIKNKKNCYVKTIIDHRDNYKIFHVDTYIDCDKFGTAETATSYLESALSDNKKFKRNDFVIRKVTYTEEDII